ncbi:MAG: prepilin-type N-terminal cleavage/methylation domain-containing protein [Candidatus Krumholzibacteria bacterium]|nr:prepilin-type N-terminal cleavage/methylation domain-containing protein [Candidatus Krumholzibacteria bacterium]
MKNREGFTLIELMIVVVILALLATIAIPNFIKIQGRAKEAKVKGAAHTLQLTAEDFAVRNGGIYSDAQAELLPLLPVNKNGTRNLENSFTGIFSEPQFAAGATTSGQVGIVGVADATGAVSGYLINGWGIKDEILLISNGN